MIFQLITLFVCTVQFSATVYAAPSKTSATILREKITPEAMCENVKKWQQVKTVLANVARFPQSAVDEFDSNLANLQKKYPVDTNFGAYVDNLRGILKNRSVLKWFSFLEQDGFKRFEELMCAKPELFAPLFESFALVIEDVLEGKTNEDSRRFVDNANTETDSAAMAQLRQIVDLNSELASIARITPEAAAEIDSVFSELIKTNPENTSFGQALVRQRSLVKNRRALLWFDFLDRAGAGKLEKLFTLKKHFSTPTESRTE